VEVLIENQKSGSQLQAMADNKELGKKDAKTIFRDLLNSNLPPEEKSIERMWHDGQVFNIAGSETTPWALANCAFCLLSNPEMLKEGKGRGQGGYPDGTIGDISVSEMEALPYLVCYPLIEQDVLLMSFRLQ
jgi:hypothetical protein